MRLGASGYVKAEVESLLDVLGYKSLLPVSQQIKVTIPSKGTSDDYTIVSPFDIFICHAIGVEMVSDSTNSYVTVDIKLPAGFTKPALIDEKGINICKWFLQSIVLDNTNFIHWKAYNDGSQEAVFYLYFTGIVACTFTAG